MNDMTLSLPARTGLTDAEASSRLAADGFNELPQQRHRSALDIVLEVLCEPMLALLLGSGVIYLLLGDLKEAAVLLVFAMLSVLITVVQETRTERVLEALRDLTSPRALVIRDGARVRIAGRDVVRGDLVVLTEGDRVPADAILFEAHDLLADESLLTGESVPVRKVAPSGVQVGKSNRPGGDDLPCVFSGSLIVRGSGIGEVTATGGRSEIGKIGQSLGALELEPSRLKLQTQKLVLYFAIAGGAVSALAVVLYGLLRGGWLDALLAGIAIGMSMLPEEFPVVLTVFMAMGAWRISQGRVLTRRAAAIETLGAATVLCTDKTGTLTENRMSVAEIRTVSGDLVWTPDAKEPWGPAAQIAKYGRLASAQAPTDPMDKALHALASDPLAVEQLGNASEWTLTRSYGLRPELLAVTHVWRTGDEAADCLVATKGAPESIAKLCRLDATELAVLKTTVDQMAAAGLRVLGVARASFSGADWPTSPHGFAFEYLGLVGLADPLRGGVRGAVAECRSAGVRVIMITGDYPATAQAIARQAGIACTDVIDGDALRGMDDANLSEKLKRPVLFARIMPEQKLRIVIALKANGEIVAMTGDGVNDAPSLKAAHIGIAMGGRGTDVAREASSIVLLDDDFGSIVRAIRLGRRIYDNLRKAMAFILAVHIPIAGLALLPLFLGMPIILGPIHIAFLEMVIDPVCSLVFEAETEEDNIMQKPPRPPGEPLFAQHQVIWSLLQGTLAFCMVGAIFVTAFWRGMPETELRALVFFSLIMTIVSLILVNRSFSASLITAIRRPNTAFVWVLVAVALTLGLSLLWPTAKALFRFGPLHADDLTVTVMAGVTVLLVLEFLKSRLLASPSFARPAQ
jgi:P-type Ca2+ transporter type 2C